RDFTSVPGTSLHVETCAWHRSELLAAPAGIEEGAEAGGVAARSVALALVGLEAAARRLLEDPVRGAAREAEPALLVPGLLEAVEVLEVVEVRVHVRAVGQLERAQVVGLRGAQVANVEPVVAHEPEVVED